MRDPRKDVTATRDLVVFRISSFWGPFLDVLLLRHGETPIVDRESKGIWIFGCWKGRPRETSESVDASEDLPQLLG